MAFTFPPFNKNSSYLAGIPMGVELDFLDKIILVGAKDFPVFRTLARTPVNSIKAVWLTDQMRKPRDATASAKKYVEDIQAPEPNLKQENENVVQVFLDEASVPNITKSLSTIDNQQIIESEIAKKAIEHVADMEAAFFSDTIPFLSANDTDSNVLGGVWNFVPAANEFDHRGALGVPTKTLDVDDIFDMQQAVWEKGGDPTNIYLTAKLKRQVNKLIEAKKLYKVNGTDEKKINLMIDSIETDFGTTNFNISRSMSELGQYDRMLCMDEEYVRIGMLDDTHTEDVITSKTAVIKRITTHLTYLYTNGSALSASYGFIS